MRALPIACLCILQLTGMAQTEKTDTGRRSKHPVKNGIWILPSGAERINGLALGVSTLNCYGRPLRVNGVNVDLFPGGVFLAPWVLTFHAILTINPVTDRDADREDYFKVDTGIHYAYLPKQTVSGLHVQLTGMRESNMYGLGINGLFAIYGLQRGVAISSIGNIAEEFRGLQFSLWSNSAELGRGVQMGLFNKCDYCKGLQIGLLNRNGRRLMPLINWSRKLKAKDILTVRPPVVALLNSVSTVRKE